MKILHVVALIQASTGGPAVSVTRLAAEQAKMGHEVTLACLDYPHLGPQVATSGVRVVSVKGNFLAVRGRGWCPEFRRVVMEEAEKADVVHNHGLWMWTNAYAREAAVVAGKPLVISPRGMLESWSLNRSKWRKAVAWQLFERKNLQSAALFHATAESEAESIRDATKRLKDQETKRPRWEGEKVEKCEGETRLIVAPNGVDLPDLTRKPSREALETMFPVLKGRRWVVFMSRLHPKKGVDVLLRAWRKQQQNVERGAGGREQGAGVENPGGGESLSLSVSSSVGRCSDLSPVSGLRPPNSGCPVLILSGPDLIGYGKEVERMVRELGLEGSVVTTGEVQGEVKDCLLANADVFVLPSYSENFGIVFAEAMAWGRPVIASTGTPWKEVADVGAGWWIKPEEDALAQALHEALGTRREELEAMGVRGRALVERSYTWEAPAERLVRAYREVTGDKGQEAGFREQTQYSN